LIPLDGENDAFAREISAAFATIGMLVQDLAGFGK
jgi:hypothetical protein